MTSASVQASLAVSIKWSLLAAVLFLLLILGGVSVMAQLRLAALGQTITQLGQQHLPEVRRLGEIELAMTRIRLTSVRLALTTSAEQRQDTQELLARRLENFDRLLAEHQKSIARDSSASLLFATFLAKWKHYRETQARMADPAMARDREALDRLINADSFAAFNDVVGAIDDGIRLANLRADDAVAKAEQERATFAIVLVVVNSFSVMVGLATLIFVVREVSLPIRRMTEAMELIAKGNLSTEIPFADRRNELGLMARALAIFRKSLLENERLSAATRTLSELSEWLQAAKSEPELYGMICDVLARLMPECKGTLYIYAKSRDILDAVTTWNGEQKTPCMHPDDCWALRRGHPYLHGVSQTEFRCAHLTDDVPEDYCCIPTLAHGETVGLLHFEYRQAGTEPTGERKAKFADRHRLGLACAEHISVAIANIKLRDELRDRSVRDALTGLNNRRHLIETARREFARATSTNGSVGVLSIDVDHFKSLNDNHGHDAGDAVLRCVGECMRSLFRDDAIPCRFGGEEFVVLLPGANLERAALRAEELRSQIEAMSVRHVGGRLPPVTVSIGVAAFPSFGDNLTDVLKASDAALYEAKGKGRNRVELASASSARERAAPTPDSVDGVKALVA